ncbi:General secretion pathway protein F / Type II secretory pathway, component PulF / Type IV fimbrial assembly protein PilC [Rubrivivax sp. A210]|uniref:type II secretion system F family protein n=1 Tax=Rubrivivax sp. A210 TaxID=2772301 RepID=UPI00191998AC|nr:type II secretion system F family protein [Rubrivivax sp. A210]CAD5373350.1 General secretion pathway protein F / Type II secretory pathway, component PulF / Type IV fimbrial assembly protein PilC [Rubrivivax sp. A210]
MSRPGEARVRPAAARPGAALDDEQFAVDLGLMLNSGLTLMDTLKTLRERAHGAVAHTLDAMATRLRQGETLSQAMLSSGAFRPALVACVKSSELTGDMADSLRRYAANAARMRSLRSRLVSALVYPGLLLVVASAVVVFLLVVVVPRFALVLEGSGREMPALSRVLIVVGRTLNDVPAPLWLGLAALALWGGFGVVQAARERRLEAMLTAVAARIPGVRDLVRAFGHSQFSRSGAMLVRAGVPALKALAMCRELLAGADRQALDKALAAAAAGAPLSLSLHQQGVIDTLGLRVLRVAEQTGALEAALERLADVHDQGLERTLDRVGRLIEPVLMLGIGLVVGGIVVLMYLPIFQLAASL